MAQHTPGPWKAVQTTSLKGPFAAHNNWAIENEEGIFVRVTHGASSYHPDGEEGFKRETEANAQLIACAPNLLHQLDSLHNIAILISNKHHAGNPIPDDLWADLHDYALAAHSLIAQATEGTQS